MGRGSGWSLRAKDVSSQAAIAGRQGDRRCRLETQRRGEAAPGTVRAGAADAHGEGMEGPGLEQREPHLVLRKRRRTA